MVHVRGPPLPGQRDRHPWVTGGGLGWFVGRYAEAGLGGTAYGRARDNHEPTLREQAFLHAATRAETVRQRAADAGRARLRGQRRLILVLAALVVVLAAALATALSTHGA